MLTAVVVFLRTLSLICCGHQAIALENVALRQQLAALKRTVKRPQLRPSDRLFWILFASAWRDWRQALVLVQPTRTSAVFPLAFPVAAPIMSQRRSQRSTRDR